MIRKLLFFILLFGATNLSAQTIFELDSIDSSDDSIKIDNYLSQIDYLKFDSTNFLHLPLIFSNDNPFSTLSFKFEPISILDNEKFQISNRIYNIRIPKTYVYYGVVSAKQQDFYIQHIQRVGQFNLAIDYQRNKGEGFYIHQEFSNEKLNAQINYTTKKNNYSIVANYNYRKINQNENGGLDSDSLFESKLFSSKTLPVNLNSANNTFTQHSLQLNQFFIPNKLNNKFYFNLNLSYNNYNRVYSDIPDTSYFEYILLDSTISNDSYTKDKYSQDFNIHFNSFIIGKIGFKSEYLTYSQNEIDTSNLSHSIQFDFGKKINNISIKLNGSYLLTGFNKNNYEINSHLIYNFNQNNFKNIQVDFSFKNQSPDLFYLRYSTNYYRWNNTFSNYNQLYSRINLNTKFGGLAYDFTFFHNFIFLNEFKLPRQLNELIQVQKFSYSYSKNFKKTNLKLFACYQQSDKDYYRLPEILGYADININGHLKALELQFGVVGWYFSSYFANAYDPVINQFYLQNEKMVGNYPYFDFYIRSSIKSVEMKFAIHHLNAGLMNNGYYSTLSYPSAPRRFSFALSSKFTD